MAKKTPDEQWEEAERLGPYQIHEQVTQSGHEGGQLFRATHEETGVTALVLKAGEGLGARMTPHDWRVRYLSSTSPRYVSMEVEQSPWSFTSQKHSVEELIFLFEGLNDGVRQMARHVPGAREPRGQRRWVRGMALAGAALAGALLFALTPHLLAPRALENGSANASGTPVGAVDIPLANSLTDTAPEWPAALMRPLPQEPYKGQKRPPCAPRVEAEIHGACWVPHELKAPCPPELNEHQGKCYTAAYKAQPAPRSFGE